MDWTGNAEVIVAVRRPGEYKRTEVALQLNGYVAKPMNPLPSMRDLGYRNEDYTAAVLQQKERRRLAEFIARQLTEALIKAMEEADTVNGYPQEEWK